VQGTPRNDGGHGPAPQELIDAGRTHGFERLLTRHEIIRRHAQGGGGASFRTLVYDPPMNPGWMKPFRRGWDAPRPATQLQEGFAAAVEP